MKALLIQNHPFASLHAYRRTLSTLGALSLVEGEDSPCHCFRFDRVFGIQYHLEATVELVLDWLSYDCVTP